MQQSHCSQTPMRTSTSQSWHDRDQASFAFITTDLLRFMTLPLGHGTASDGMGHIWRDFWFQEAGQVLPSRLRRIFLNSWFLFETLKILHPTHHHSLEDIPMLFDGHDHDEIHFVSRNWRKCCGLFSAMTMVGDIIALCVNGTVPWVLMSSIVSLVACAPCKQATIVMMSTTGVCV